MEQKWPRGTFLAVLREKVKYRRNPDDSNNPVLAFAVFDIAYTNNVAPAWLRLEQPLKSWLSRLGVSGWGDIFLLQTNPAFLRLGYATKVLNSVFEAYPNFIWRLECDPCATAAQALYAKHGFVWFGYLDREHLLMRSSISALKVYDAISPPGSRDHDERTRRALVRQCRLRLSRKET